MGDSTGILQLWDSARPILCVFLVLVSAFFVVSEYALVSCRRSRLDSLGRSGSRTARALLLALDDLPAYIAATQIGITMVGIAIGTFTEPYVTSWLSGAIGALDARVIKTLSYLLVVFVLLVIGELCPKFIALKHSDRLALVVFPPMRVFVNLMSPFIWLAQTTAGLILRPLGVDLRKYREESIPKEELLMLVQSGGAAAGLDKLQADMVTRALRLDVLDARDIMIHRLDIKWLDASLTKSELVARLTEIPYSRMPVARGDIDDLVGVAYLHDIVKHLEAAEFNLESIVRPVVAVPENLTMAKILDLMRLEKTQMLIVMDEYGGTSGLVTLEDVVEEVFGELEDQLEGDRRPIETYPSGRISVRADVRIDELVETLGLRYEVGTSRETLATMLVEELANVPRTGDSVKTSLGVIRVENMARRRITRVSIMPASGVMPESQPEGN